MPFNNSSFSLSTTTAWEEVREEDEETRRIDDMERGFANCGLAKVIKFNVKPPPQIHTSATTTTTATTRVMMASQTGGASPKLRARKVGLWVRGYR